MFPSTERRNINTIDSAFDFRDSFRTDRGNPGFQDARLDPKTDHTMKIDLSWVPAELGSCMHAMYRMHRQLPLIARELEPALSPCLLQLGTAADAAGFALNDLWPTLLPVACSHEETSVVARTVLRELRHSRSDHTFENALEIVLRDSIAAMRVACPSMAELSRRERPLREQWEARGPGLMDHLWAATGGRADAVAATVHLVQPVSGGDGMAHPDYGSIHIEALLTNAPNQPPEAIRIGWLLAQLWCRSDTPAWTTAVEMRLDPALTLVPVVIWAAEQVELARFDAPTVEQALVAWRLGDKPRATASRLVEWWNTRTEQP